MRHHDIRQTSRRAVLSSALLLLVLGAAPFAGSTPAQHSNGQAGQLPPPQTPTMPGDPAGMNEPPGDRDPMRARMDEDRRKAMNDDRHKRLAADVDKLLALTNELKTDVDKTTKDELSLEVIKKAQEIEKLAHDVQSRMKN